MTASIRLLAACLVATLAANPALADFNGGRVEAGRSTLTIERPDDPEALALLFGSSGAFRQYVERLSSKPSSLIATYGLIYTGKHGEAYKFILSSRTAGARPLEQDTAISTASSAELAQKLCDITRLCSTQPTTLRPPLVPTTGGRKGQVQLAVGDFPTARPPMELDRKQMPPPRAGAASAELFDLGGFIERRINERQSRDAQEVELAPLPLPGTAAAATPVVPKLIAVHCTAFHTSVPAGRAWAERLRQKGTRYKSHGIILADGTYIEIWPFEERRVWATKTETCAETTRKAMGSIINIELHYYCGYKGPDKTMVVRATYEQYRTLGKLIDGLVVKFGPLRVLTHKEIDRGLRDGHVDPLGFDFATLKTHLSIGTLSRIEMITDERQRVPSAPKWSNYWPPQFSGVPELEAKRQDDCKRDQRVGGPS